MTVLAIGPDLGRAEQPPKTKPTASQRAKYLIFLSHKLNLAKMGIIQNVKGIAGEDPRPEFTGDCG
jgi:hypothetical protein